MILTSDLSALVAALQTEALPAAIAGRTRLLDLDGLPEAALLLRGAPPCRSA